MYVSQEALIGLRGINEVFFPTGGHPNYPGTIVRMQDPTLGGGEFVMLYGTNGVVAGSLVTYDQLTGATVLAQTGAKGGSPVAVAIGAPQTGMSGWFQVAGNALIAKTAGAAIAAGAAVGVSATPGAVATSAGGAATAGALTGAVVNAAAAAGDALVNVQISRPIVN
jgi:hypothetical protein